jgi:hypothetical protein
MFIPFKGGRDLTMGLADKKVIEISEELSMLDRASLRLSRVSKTSLHAARSWPSPTGVCDYRSSPSTVPVRFERGVDRLVRLKFETS